MSISFIFSFAPIPLTDEFSPLAHAAVLARRRQAESQLHNGMTRHRIRPLHDQKIAEPALG